MNSKAQSSFEMILVAGVMFVFLLIVYGNYFAPAESFNASAEAKLAAVDVLSKATTAQIMIKEIEFHQTEEVYNFNVITEPELDGKWKEGWDYDTATEAIEAKIAGITKRTTYVRINNLPANPT